MSIALLIIAFLISLAAGPGFLFFFARGKQSNSATLLEQMDKEKADREALFDKARSIREELLDFEAVAEPARELTALKDATKLERGRVTITQAELETVESRLREIDEIERELDASNVETQEELKVLQRKEAALTNKNNNLKEKLAMSKTELDKVLGDIKENIELSQKVSEMMESLVKTETKIEEMLQQIQSGNEQYFILKRRYDALDIEYAQLYEKFSAAEGSPQ